MSIDRLFSVTGRVSLLFAAFACFALANESICKMETFKGPYSLTVTGFVLPPLTIGEFGFGGGEGAVPIQGVQLITSDGHGNLTDKESLSLGGAPLAATAAEPFSNHYGTYTINPDCTGIAFLTNASIICPSSPNNCPTANFVSLAFIINKAGTKIRMVGIPTLMGSTAAYDSGGIERVVTSIGEKIDPTEPSFDEHD